MNGIRWGRRGRLGAAMGLAVGLVLAGCGDDGGKKEAFGSDIVKHVDVATRGGDFQGVIDATVSPDGKMAYFTASSSRGPGVFRVPADGGQAEPVVAGAPFVKPVGVAVSTDGGRLFVADGESGIRGAIYAVGLAGGGATAVAGTEGRAPRGIEVAREGDQDVLYFTGREPGHGQPGVFKLPASGSTAPTPVVKGAPLTAPDAVTVARGGAVYVTDRGQAGAGAVYRVRGGAPEKIADIRAPNLAGVTLTLDESILLVSSLSPTGTDQVLVVDVASGRSGVFSKTIGENRQGGGLHRAHNVNVFAWADSVAGPEGGGRVYILRP